jgi:(p)ppGpp synthase/HD superfamily hydrolase
MAKPPRMTYADKQAMLARGEPWVVHPREVAKLPEFHGTDPEIILACILEAGILDTGDVLKTAIHQRHGLAVTDEAKAAYERFRRMWQQPTDEQRRAVLDRALRIATGSNTRRRAFEWPTTH